jgi:hypothetical protein
MRRSGLSMIASPAVWAMAKHTISTITPMPRTGDQFGR